MLSNEEIIFRTKTILEKIRPYIQRDGGDVEFVKYGDGIVYLKMLGACVGCVDIDQTITDGVEALLLEEVPGVIGVELVSDGEEDV